LSAAWKPRSPVSAALQAEKQSTLSEFRKVNLVVSRMEAKITGGLATQTQSVVCTTPHYTSLVRVEDIGQGNSNTTSHHIATLRILTTQV